MPVPPREWHPESEWVPTDAMLPRAGEIVLVARKGPALELLALAWMNDGKWYYPEGGIVLGVRWWREVPDLPEELTRTEVGQ
jgi:hypothetical protein